MAEENLGEDIVALEARWRAQIDREFEKFLSDPLVQISVRVLGRDDSTLTLLLKAAFRHGAGSGKVTALTEVMSSLIQTRPLEKEAAGGPAAAAPNVLEDHDEEETR